MRRWAAAVPEPELVLGLRLRKSAPRAAPIRGLREAPLPIMQDMHSVVGRVVALRHSVPTHVHQARARAGGGGSVECIDLGPGTGDGEGVGSTLAQAPRPCAVTVYRVRRRCPTWSAVAVASP